MGLGTQTACAKPCDLRIRGAFLRRSSANSANTATGHPQAWPCEIVMLHRQLRARPGVCQGPASAVLWPLHPTAAARPSISPEPLPHRPCIRTQVADAAQPTSADVKPRRRRKQSAPASVSASAPPEPSTAEVADGVLLYGFPPHELAAIHEQRDTVFPGLDAARVGVVSAAAAARQTAGSLAQQAPTTLEQAVADYAAQEATKCHEDSAQVQVSRAHIAHREEQRFLQ